MTKKYPFNLFLLLLLSSVFFTACNKNNGGTSRLQVSITDAPADYDAINIDIQGVEIHTDGSAGNNDKGWVKLDLLKPGIYNILDFTNGLDTLLTDVEIPSGKISQIRLVLGNNNTIKVSGKDYALATPSAMQSGLKLLINTTFEEGVTYKIILDFDAARSIVLSGNGSYSLKPVIRTIVKAETGGIKGTVSPLQADPVVYAISSAQDSVSAYPNKEGKFLVQGLKAGTYKVVLVPKEGYQTKTLNNITVNIGSSTDLGTVTISQ
ncbi:MAG: DUF4382 domain-containing protein [Cytophagales bacterium]|nr:MAG: DUF4382 domain-containing protein [Cytophagales bacterium]